MSKLQNYTRKYRPHSFTEKECLSCDPPCHIDDIDPDMWLRLDLLRKKLGEPIILSSAYRTKEYEISKGRKGTSAHCIGLAVDVRCSNSAYRYRLICSALDCGFYRIGIGTNFVHLDISTNHAQNVIWTY